MNSRINKIRDILDDKKASDIEIFDLTSKDYLVDYVVIATTLNPKHGFALLDHLKTDKNSNTKPRFYFCLIGKHSFLKFQCLFLNLFSINKPNLFYFREENKSR